MEYTVVGVFRHSGDADMAAAFLKEEYALAANEIDMIGEAEWDQLTPPAVQGTDAWLLAAVTGYGLQSLDRGDEELLGQRWIDKLWEGETLVVSRTGDPDQANEMAKGMREQGADRIDILTH